jgi:TonB family protein
MKDPNQVRDRRLTLIEWDRVPRSSAILLAVFAHMVGWSLFFLSRHTGKVHIVHREYQIVQKLSGAPSLVFNSKPSQLPAVPARIHRRTRQARAQEPASGGQGGNAQTLQQQAKEATAAITLSIKFRQTYGFSPMHDYRLAVQTAGDLPAIAADEVPQHFQQYVIVEVTIDVDGRVALARVVAGLAPPTVEQKLLSAIREFKYNPATRDGVPIPSQRDIVVHIPT